MWKLDYKLDSTGILGQNSAQRSPATPIAPHRTPVLPTVLCVRSQTIKACCPTSTHFYSHTHKQTNKHDRSSQTPTIGRHHSRIISRDGGLFMSPELRRHVHLALRRGSSLIFFGLLARLFFRLRTERGCVSGACARYLLLELLHISDLQLDARERSTQHSQPRLSPVTSTRVPHAQSRAERRELSRKDAHKKHSASPAANANASETL